MNIEPIGIIRSCFGEKFAIPRQPGLCPSAWGRLLLDASLMPHESLRGIEQFSHLWLIFGFHRHQDKAWHPTVRPPRLGGNQRVGVFASRSTFRPNGLGLSVVRLEGIDWDSKNGSTLLLGGIDLTDGTPIYDIKPYLPYADFVSDADGGYAKQQPACLPVQVETAAQPAFAALPVRAQRTIQEAFALDPRPAIRAEDESPRVYAAKLCGHDVSFDFLDGTCRILQLRPSDDAGLLDI
ncbi:MAG: tRNA (N6-threonylcarbamoyladenosine(37)-N6)-methyltransferase TrmO [Verrucomicrobia bacterium]|nr:MAG: tRNA (N6-threonylcarbamoyladenosine(37)-N6)-methyltransferase TrmO [Verrucomicrobiota bacterium]